MANDKQVYIVQGFTCANCAAKFERNVKELPDVEDAKVNFAAGKITVIGEATVHELERAGSFENLKLREEKDGYHEEEPFWKKKKNIFVGISSILVIVGWVLSLSRGEGDTLSIILFLAAMGIGGYQLFLQGLKNLVRLDFDMKTLMTIAIIGAAIIGEWGEGALVVVLFAISEALESYSMERARKSIRALVDTTPKQATVIRNGIEAVIPIEEIVIGDTILVRPGEKMPMDGLVTQGVSAVNQAAITGESVPVTKQAGDEVYAGTINEEGVLHFRVTKHVKDTTLARIIHLVEEAQTERAPAQQFVDKFAKYYTPAIMLLALLVATIPPLFFAAEWSQWIYLGLATLVVGCPCALVISTPVAIVTAISNSARNGVLIKGGIYLEQAGTIDAIAFDKTGTLTRGIPSVTNIDPLGEMTAEGLMRYAHALEKYSNHPLAKAIVRKAEEMDELLGAGEKLEAENVLSITGKGMLGKIVGETHFIGSPSYVKGNYPQFFTKELEEKTFQLQGQGKTVVFVGSDSQLLGLIGIQDELRKNTARVFGKIKEAGIGKTVMLTGDNAAAAKAIGSAAGITDVQFELLPDKKLAYIKRLKSEGYRVAMVGDGMNDAPSLATADVGIAMGTIGTDAALETADIALMGDDLRKIPYLVNLSKKTLRIIKQNIAFSLALKALALLLVPFGWLTLWIAIFADMGATLLVTLNSLRIMRVQDDAEE